MEIETKLFVKISDSLDAYTILDVLPKFDIIAEKILYKWKAKARKEVQMVRMKHDDSCVSAYFTVANVDIIRHNGAWSLELGAWSFYFFSKKNFSSSLLFFKKFSAPIGGAALSLIIDRKI
ncbi:MAG: hypothetical protein LBJ36_05720 [Synergistaceae bacterium]|jgi:hypothetical protein|nr:hypothetical protein [Synergistaceae bacterium]